MIAVTGVNIIGGASPEGSVSFNRYLSRARAEAVYGYFRDKGYIDRGDVDFRLLGRDWKDLRDMAAADPSLPFRDDVLAAIDSVIAASGDEEPLTSHSSVRLYS